MRKLKFDLTVNSNALLCPNAQDFYSKAYITENVANNFRTVPGVKESTKLAKNTFANLIKTAGCSWADTDSVLDSVTISVCSLDAMTQICQYDLESSFVSLKMAKGDANWQEASFMSYYFEEMAKEVEAEIQDIRWNGDTTLTGTTYLNTCDGYIKKLLASSAVAVTGATLTASNIIAAISNTLAALPEAVKTRPQDVRIFMSASNALLYQIAVNALNHIENYTGDLPLTFGQYTIAVQPGMSNSYIVAGSKNDFVYAFDGEGDAKDVKAINMSETTAEPILRTRVGLKVGFHLLNETQIAYYKVV